MSEEKKVLDLRGLISIPLENRAKAVFDQAEKIGFIAPTPRLNMIAYGGGRTFGDFLSVFLAVARWAELNGVEILEDE